MAIEQQLTQVSLLSNGVLFAGAGAFSGLMAGLLGIGGGIILVPALIFIFSHNPDIPANSVMHLAAGTTLASMIFTASSSVLAHRARGRILMPVYVRMAPGIIVGIIIGALIADMLPTRVLKTLFGLFLLLIVYKMVRMKPLSKRRRFPKPWVNRLVCLGIGLKSGLLGIGGGAIIIPYLTYCGVKVRKIAGIASLCSLTVAVIGCVVYAITGYDELNLPVKAIGYVYWPATFFIAIPSILFAQIGANLTYSLPLKQLKISFIVFLLITAVHLLL